MLPFDRLRAGRLPFVVSCEPAEQSNHARLACGAFYGAAEFGLFFDFLQVHPLLGCKVKKTIKNGETKQEKLEMGGLMGSYSYTHESCIYPYRRRSQGSSLHLQDFFVQFFQSNRFYKALVEVRLIKVIDPYFLVAGRGMNEFVVSDVDAHMTE